MWLAPPFHQSPRWLKTGRNIRYLPNHCMNFWMQGLYKSGIFRGARRIFYPEHSSPYVRSKKSEHGTENAAIKRAKAFLRRKCMQ